MSRIILRAPLSGWAMPLEEVPDPVFAQRMAGDGAAIDPVSAVLLAPCAGEIVPMKNARHAVTVRSPEGLEVLMHVGIDTVALDGAGFQMLVQGGQRVETGTPLLRFDLDFVARQAKSLVTPVVLANSGRVARVLKSGAIEAGEAWLEVEPAVSAQASTAPAVSRRMRVPFEHGLHVRPAAQVAAALHGLDAQVTLRLQGRSADARSPVAMMALGARCGDEVEVQARGTHAERALDALGAVLALPAAPEQPAPLAKPGGRIEGAKASPGLAAGRCVRWEQPPIELAPRGSGVESERQALDRALTAVRVHLAQLRSGTGGEGATLLDAHLELLDDPALHAAAGEHIAQGTSAGYAWREATRDALESLSALDDERMRERAADLRDLERQVTRVAAGLPPETRRTFAADAIVIAAEILPSQMIVLQHAGVAGICTAHGGPTSHMAILASAHGIPALVAAGDTVLRIPEGTRLVLDADHGYLDIDPPAATWSAIERDLHRRTEERSLDLAAAREPATMRDGTRIVVNANLGSHAEVAAAIAQGAEGCGLLRTEFLFLDRRDPPSEEEQAAEYQRIATALRDRAVAIRTLDVGGDKPLAYLPLPREENPALGLRGIRTSLAQPDLLRMQLRAIARVKPAGIARVLLPMVTDAADVRTVREMLAEAARAENVAPPALGAMIETPSSALLAEALADACDFLSIGTNDLSQYTLAMDRGHPRLAARLDALHPAVLMLIARVADAAHARGKSACICGALGSDAEALPILIGLGVHEISAAASAIPRLKRVARSLDLASCRALAAEALSCESAAEVRALLATRDRVEARASSL